MNSVKLFENQLGMIVHTRVCVCMRVCVCVREREREWKGVGKSWDRIKQDYSNCGLILAMCNRYVSSRNLVINMENRHVCCIF